MGGSAGGGGSTSGASDFPTYMKDAHGDWLDHTGADSMTYSVVDLMNTLQTGVNPYDGIITVNPEQVFFKSGTGITDYRAPYEMLRCFDRLDFNTVYTGYKPDYDTEAKFIALKETYDTEIDFVAKRESYDLDTAFTGYKPAYDTEAKFTSLKDAYDTETSFASIREVYDLEAAFTLLREAYDVDAAFTAIREIYDLDTAYSGYVADDSTVVGTAITAAGVLSTDDINSNVLPQFQHGMADINAVMSSAFVIGEAHIWDGRTKAQAKLDADVRYKRLTDGTIQALERVKSMIGWKNISNEMALKRVDEIVKWKVSSADTAIKRVEANVDWKDKNTSMALKRINEVVQWKIGNSDVTLKRIGVANNWEQIATTLALERVKNHMGWKELSNEMALKRVDEILKFRAMNNDTALKRVAAGTSWIQATESIAHARMQELIEWRRIVTTASAEFARMYTAARMEISAFDTDNKAKGGLWDLESYQYGCNVLASISGAALAKGYTPSKGSAAAGALSGALAGASIAAQIPGGQNPMGIGIGAVVGGLAGLMG